MALGRLLADVRALNAELPSVAAELEKVGNAGGDGLRASESASRAAAQAAEATNRSNQSAVEAAKAIAAIPAVNDATFTISSDEGVRRLTDLATDSEGVGLRASSSSGSGGAGGRGSFAPPPPGILRRLLGQGNGVNGGLLNPQPPASGPVRIQPLTPTPGEKLIAAKLDSLANSIRTSAEANGTTIRMGSKS